MMKRSLFRNRARIASSLGAQALGVVFALVSTAADLPSLVLPQGVGVNIHFNRGHEADLDMIAAAGIQFVRMDLGWAGIERRKGEYDWSAYDELTSNLEKRGLRALYILDYSNPLYEETVVTRNPVSGQDQRDTASPQHAESIAAFARWAAAAAERYRGRRIVWEIWNEPNITFWKPKPDVRQYNELALATCRAIRAADSKATVIGPATSEIPMAFLADHFASGILTLLDAVSVHPYRSYAKSPETAADEYAALRELIARHAPRNRRPPILSGEWGYASHAKGVTLETQAAFVARQQLVNLLCEVPLSIWYDWSNDGPDPGEREHNFGLVTSDLKPKPAYSALRALTSELQGYRVARRLGLEASDDYAVLFSRRGGPDKLAVWTTGTKRTVSIPVHRRSKVTLRAANSGGVCTQTQRFGSTRYQFATVSGPAGQPQKIELTADRLIMEVGPHPFYLTVEGVKFPE